VIYISWVEITQNIEVMVTMLLQKASPKAVYDTISGVIVTMVIIVAFPEISLLLPNMMR